MGKLPKDHDPEVVGACTECGSIQRPERMYGWQGDGTPPCSTCGAPTFVSHISKVRKTLEKYKQQRGIPG